MLKKINEIILSLCYRNYLCFLPDKIYLKMLYKIKMGNKLNLDSPVLFSEKLQWLKLNDRKKIYSNMVDKFKSKDFIKRKVGEKYVIPTLGVYKSFDDIDFEKLPKEFIIKCTHDSGGLVIVDDKSKFNKELAKKIIEKSLKRKYFYNCREWPYKNVKPQIIVEKLLKNKKKDELVEYNIFCFNGIPKIIMTCHGDKRIKRYNDFYDIDFNKIDMNCIYPNSNFVEEKPKQLKKMLEIASKLSEGIPHLRVDLYLCDSNIYVGELTFYHWGGFTKFTPSNYDKILGDMLELPNIKKH